MIESYKGMHPKIAESAYYHESSVIIGQVELKENASIWCHGVLRGDMGQISIGKNSNIQDNCTVHNSTGIPVVVGDYVTVGHNAILHSCTVGDNSLIGMGAIILDGAIIGKNCLIGAGALVTPGQVIPDYSLVLGSPGKVVRTLTDEDVNGHIKNAETYVEKALAYKSEAKA